MNFFDNFIFINPNYGVVFYHLIKALYLSEVNLYINFIGLCFMIYFSCNCVSIHLFLFILLWEKVIYHLIVCLFFFLIGILVIYFLKFSLLNHFSNVNLYNFVLNYYYVLMINAFFVIYLYYLLIYFLINLFMNVNILRQTFIYCKKFIFYFIYFHLNQNQILIKFFVFAKFLFQWSDFVKFHLNLKFIMLFHFNIIFVLEICIFFNFKIIFIKIFILHYFLIQFAYFV